MPFRNRPRITIAQSQRLALNPALHASIRVIEEDAAGLAQMLEEAAAENPALRLRPPPERGPADWLPRWQSTFYPPQGQTEPAAPEPSLIAYVTARLPGLIRNGQERRIALALVEALEPTGWLGRPPAAIAADLDLPAATVEAMLARLQELDPPGLFARDLAECLRLQAEDAGRMDAVLAVMLGNLGLLAEGALDRLARLAGTTEAEIAARLRLIRSFNPKPGTVFSPFHAADLREPDLIVRRAAPGGSPADTWEVTLNRCALPVLSASGSGPEATAARMMIGMVEKRNASLLRVARDILIRQSAALERGREYLVPMTLALVAEAVGLHESTISRLVAGVYADTPYGPIRLRALFSSAVGGVAAAAIRGRLQRLVAEEDAARPLSDQALALKLAPDGGLARRTVAKYRAELGLPPAAERRRAATSADRNR